MATEKLYWADPFATTFEASTATLSRFGDRPSIVLDRTIFYPEAGGQLADVGSLVLGDRTVAIDDVQIDDAGVIHHLITGATLAPEELAAGVRGAIDAARRRDHMAQHTAQHALSRALVDVARADTVSSRLGSNACTIDVHLGDVPDAELAAAEDRVNALVRDDVAVRALFPTDAELATMDLRRAPKVSANVRIIEIEGFDLSPCGGTHCTKSGQIGLVRIVGTERYKGKLRITFHAAQRAIDDARAKERVLAALAGDFTCGLLDVPAAVGKLRGDLKARTDALSATRGELVELMAERLWSEHPPDPSGTTIVAVYRPKDDVSMLRALAGRLAARADVVAICAAPEAEAPDSSMPHSCMPHSSMIVVQRGAQAKLDCGAWLKAAAARCGGRGGGRPERAEGKLNLQPAAETLAPLDAKGFAAALETLARA